MRAKAFQALAVVPSSVMRGGVVRLIKRSLFPEGSVRTVLVGPARGMRYRVFHGYGVAFVFGRWERDVAAAMCTQVRKGAVAYDVGANYGMHALLLGRLVGAAGRVFAFEPHPQVYSALCENLRLNGFHHVTPIREAVADHTGAACLDPGESRSCGKLATEGLPVATTTIDDFVFDRGTSPPDFIKIDVEGAESLVLQGAKRTLATYKPRMIIELHNPAEDRTVGALLLAHGYRAFRIHDGRPIKNMESGWPDPDGMSGTVLALAGAMP